MSEASKVSAEDVRYAADLAHLALGDEEAARLQHDLNAILDHIAQLNELDTAAILPMARVAEVAGTAALITRDGNVLRADIERPSLDRERVLACAPETDSVFFKVPKVIER